MDEKSSHKRADAPDPDGDPSTRDECARPRQTVAPTKASVVVALDPVRRARSAKGTGRDPRAAIEANIGRQLRTLYDDVLSQPVPDRLIDLIQKLESREPDKTET